MNKFGINTVSNVAAKLWSLVSIYVFIPLYIRLLGETAYGLVSFFATLQGALNLLGLGLSNTLRREFAVGQDTDRKYKLLRSVELIYCGLGALIVAICFFGSDFIAEQWLNIEELDPGLVSTVIALMGVSIALQLVANLYAGCLFGLEHQVLTNGYTVVWSAVKSCGSLAVIWFVKPDLVLFYAWHLVSDAVYLLVLRLSVVGKLPRQNREKWTWRDISNIASVWQYTCGLLFISFVALINRQLDKTIISKFLDLSELGGYNLATTLGSLAGIIPTAVYTSVFPRFTQWATTGDPELGDKYLRINRFVNLILSAMAAFVAAYALPLIRAWTGSDAYGGMLSVVGTLVVLGVAVIEYQQLPYALALAHGDTGINVLVGGAAIPFIGLASYYGISRYGLLGAGVVLLVMMGLQTVVYLVLVYRKYLPGKAIAALVRDTAIPLGVSLLIAFGSRVWVTGLTQNHWLQVALAVLCGGGTLGLLLIVYEGKTLLAKLRRH